MCLIYLNDILGVDILGIDILGVDILRLTRRKLDPQIDLLFRKTAWILKSVNVSEMVTFAWTSLTNESAPSALVYC